MAHPKLPRFHAKHGKFWHVTFVDKKRNWFDLGADYVEAVKLWSRRENPNFSEEDSQVFEDMVKEYVTECLPKLAKNTQKQYLFMIDVLSKTFAGVKLRVIKPHHVYSYMAKRKLEGVNVSGNREKSLLRQMFKISIRRGWVEFNPVRDVESDPETKRSYYFDDEHFWAVYKHANPQLKLIMAVAYMLGIRVSDVLKIRHEDFTPGEPRVLTVRQQKNKVAGNYPVSPELEEVFSAAEALKTVSGTGYVFEHSRGGQRQYQCVWRAFRKALDKAGLQDVHFHDIRGKAITDATEQGRRAKDFSLHRDERQAEAYVKRRAVPNVLPLVMPVDKTL